MPILHPQEFVKPIVYGGDEEKKTVSRNALYPAQFNMSLLHADIYFCWGRVG